MTVRRLTAILSPLVTGLSFGNFLANLPQWHKALWPLIVNALSFSVGLYYWIESRRQLKRLQTEIQTEMSWKIMMGMDPAQALAQALDRLKRF